jgi:HSP20 family protein
MTLTHWNPVTGLATIEVEGLNRMFETMFTGESRGEGAWAPKVDIFETSGKDVVVKAELPDMKRENIKVTFENEVLTIEGERAFPTDVERDQYHRIERSYGAFRRSFTLQSSVDSGRVAATYQDGVLTITLPRREETKPRQIQVNG